MTSAVTDYRLDGIYKQRQDGFFMQRVKLTAGVISAEQALCVAQAAERFGKGRIHLTSRGSMEIHWLKEEDLATLKKNLAAVGLTSRGACGGAVRGITCSTQGSERFPAIEAMARRLHRHFTGNPRFERLPKKFKIGIEAGAMGRRHLIQDVGLVLTGPETDGSRYDVYCAGGLGREPQAGFLLEAAVAENRIIPLIEAIARVYAAHTPAGKRLKHLLREIGEERFRSLLAREPGAVEELPAVNGLPESFVPVGEQYQRLVAHIPAGDLGSDQLKTLALFACHWSFGYMMVSADQDITFHCTDQHDFAKASEALTQAGFCSTDDCNVTFRLCPGAHECRMGLALTREIGHALIAAMGPTARSLTWALSGCSNSCTQPQLADFGISVASAKAREDGERIPCFDVYRLGTEGLGEKTGHSLYLEELIAMIQALG